MDHSATGQSKNKHAAGLMRGLKEAIFSLYDQLVNSLVISTVIVLALITLENLILIQCLIMAHRLATDNYMNPFYEYLNYLNPAYLLSLTSTGLLTAVVFISLGFLPCLLVALLIVLQMTGDRFLKRSPVYSYVLKATGVALALVKYILYQPLLTALIAPMWCSTTTIYGADTGYTCFSSDHILILTFSVIVIALLSLLGIVSTLFLSDEQLDSRLPWAYMSQTYEFCKAAWKIAVSVLLQFAHSNSTVATYIPIVTAVIGCVNMHELYRLGFMNDRRFFYAIVTAEYILIWFSLSVFVDIVGGVNLGHPMLLGLLLLFFVPLMVFTTTWTQDRRLLKSTLANSQDPTEAEVYARIFYERVQSRQSIQDASFDGIIAMHASSCKNASCPCHDILIEQGAEEDEEEQKGDEKQVKVADMGQEKPMRKAEKSLEHVYQLEKEGKSVLGNLYSRFVISEIEQWCRKHEDKAKLHLLLAYLKFFNSDNPLSALWEIMTAEEMSTDVYEQFHIWRFNNRIERQVVQQEKGDEASRNIDKLIRFQQLMAEMQEDMQEALKLYIGFWKELQDDSPNFDYLGNVSYDIDERANKIRRTYRELIVLNPVNIYARMLYAIFTKRITKDDFEALDVSREAAVAANNLRLHSKYVAEEKFGSNSKNALFIISGQRASLGEVLCINNEVSELLGYEKHEILGHNIGKVMPPIIAAKHSSFMLRYMCSGRASPDNGKLIFPLNKVGCIVPCTYIHRVVPTLQHGLQLIGFLRHLADFSEYCPMMERNTASEDAVLCLADRNWRLLAFNVRAAKLFGIAPAQANMRKFLFSDEKPSLLRIFPQLAEEHFLETIKTAGGAEAVFNPKNVQKFMENEIENGHADQPDERNDRLTANTIALDFGSDGTTPQSDSRIRGPMTVLDLEYGRGGDSKAPAELQLKLVVVVLDQLIMRETVKADDSATVGKMGKDEEEKKAAAMEVLAEDLGSQSSASSASAMETEQKMIRGLKERIKEQRNPFFVRCFIKLGILTFLLIVSTAVAEFVLKKMLITYTQGSIVYSKTLCDTYNKAMSLPYFFSVLHDIYLYRTTTTSEGYSNRTAAYAAMVDMRLEDFRGMMINFMAQRYRFSQEHQSLINSPIIQFMDMPGKSSVSTAYTYENNTMNVAVTQYIAKGTLLHQVTLDVISKGCNYTDSDTNYELVRTFNFMINNGKGTMRYYLSKMFYYFTDDFAREFNSYSSVMTAAYIADPIVEIILLFLFIPFILKVQGSLQGIYMHICQFRKAELKAWLETCNSSSACLHASITQMQHAYNSENFDISFADYGKKKKTAESSAFQVVPEVKPEEKKSGENDGEAKEEGEEESLKMLAASHEATVAEQKQKRFSEMSHQKTKTYMSYLAFLIVYIVGFKVADGVMLADLRTQKDEKLSVVELFNRKIWGLDNTLFFFRMNIMYNTLSSYFDIPDAVTYYVDYSFGTEYEVSERRSSLIGDFATLKDTLNSLDSINYCTFAFNTASDIKSCQTIFNGIGSFGYDRIITNIMSYIKATHWQFKVQYLLGNTFSDTITSSGEMARVSDVRFKYITPANILLQNIILDAIGSWSDREMQIHVIKFVIYIIFLVLIFTLMWKKMVSNMKMDIIKALGILNILPTLHFASSPEFIDEINKSSLTN